MDKLAGYWQKWKDLSTFGKWYLLKAGVTLLVIKAGLTFLPFQTFRSRYSRYTRGTAPERLTQEQIKEVARSINIMADHLPFQLLCLPRALAAKYLLRNEPGLVLQIGVELDRVDSFEAHAWVERAGEIIIGDWNETIRYQRLWSWE
ncbi:lasso peptide biosynthesis B2 protein [Dyadobacter jejuensis]|uniref:lasso peptide biosynthesis B2 protein n=1 Tax=Dyadobacter jejuensis TaxID=1082580 RepID=UPI000D6DA3E2|nr:lasso peptide biosynthesis B2 protein [Dyadobacter jejuensis]